MTKQYEAELDMTKKPRENRVPIMMSEEELGAIDDWRFANKIATRSDAVRRLCQIGIRSDTAMTTLISMAEANFKRRNDLFDEMIKVSSEVRTTDELKHALVNLMWAIQKLSQDASDLEDKIDELSHQSRAFSRSSEMSEAFAEAEKVTAEFAKLRAIIGKGRATPSENEQ